MPEVTLIIEAGTYCSVQLRSTDSWTELIACSPTGGSSYIVAWPDLEMTEVDLLLDVKELVEGNHAHERPALTIAEAGLEIATFEEWRILLGSCMATRAW